MKKKILLSLLKYIPAAILIFMVFINLWLGISKVVTRNPVPKFLGFSTMYVLSGSMEPTILPGDMVVIKEENVKNLKVGDIVTFTENLSPYTHRITNINGDKITTKGDANNRADEPISSNKIQGKVIFRIPKIGAIAMFCKTPPGILVMFVILILLLYSGDIYNKIRSKNK